MCAFCARGQRSNITLKHASAKQAYPCMIFVIFSTSTEVELRVECVR